MRHYLAYNAGEFEVSEKFESITLKKEVGHITKGIVLRSRKLCNSAILVTLPEKRMLGVKIDPCNQDNIIVPTQNQIKHLSIVQTYFLGHKVHMELTHF